MTDPNDVGTTSLYDYPTEGNPVGELLKRIVNALKAPDEAEGWPRIVIPALVTGIAVSAVQRVVMN